MKQITIRPLSKPEPDEVVFRACGICGEPVAVTLPGPNNFLRDDIERVSHFVAHTACIAERESAKIAGLTLAAAEKKLEHWRTICPEEFQKPLDSDKRGYNAARLKMVLNWTFGEKGLLVTGETRKCKTRFVYQLLSREHQAGKTIGAWLHADLRREISAIAAGSTFGLDLLIRRLVGLDILFIDDLGKGRATPASEESLFAIIDGRARICRPMIFTCNSSSMSNFTAGLSEEYRAPMISRITETTQMLEFK